MEDNNKIPFACREYFLKESKRKNTNTAKRKRRKQERMGE